MKVFLDTSVLIKLYYRQEGTSRIDELFEKYYISDIYISQLSKIEFSSAVYKKVRTKELSLINAEDILNSFLADLDKYIVTPLDDACMDTALQLIKKYGVSGLRSLDALQLSSIKIVAQKVDIAVTDDKLLNNLIEAEGINTSYL